MQELYKEQLQLFLNRIKQRSQNFIGYPASVDYDYKELFPFLDYSLNNVGDPFVESNCDMDSKKFEREVLNFFADQFHAPKNNWWGYVTNGGSEGNLYALYLARELYPNGMVYYSESTHYSVQKNIHLLNMDSIVIRTDYKGEMDYDDLKEMIQLQRHRPVIILANIGTTMTEAKDNVPLIKDILKRLAIKSSYIHCDAALAGTYLSLLGQGSFDFSYGADSIAISGHKFIGSPIPCGVVLVKKSYKDRIGRSIPYIGTLDTTISGSRNGITPLFLWYTIQKLGRQGLLERAENCLTVADYALQLLEEAGINAWRNENALTVVFPQPNEHICKKWQLASENEMSHLICMPGVTKSHIDAFVNDLVQQQDEKCPDLESQLN
ncbi:histidine decarboxylase [Flavisolibacter tropicus]|uniref:Histidine decarboxylase n=1 Tax=Flavisolibacter tropicus TaxID=1492898 RepID=A0A172U2F1_9BACT|nr:histidine decarboxylase [Flavisolibacter tropicus]ANE53203.1 histidine decarboxylase [Flavisolibacter tropicus]